MSKAIVYGLIPGFRFDNFVEDITLERGVTICLSPNDIMASLLDTCKDLISAQDRKDIEGIKYALKIEIEDSNETIRRAINDIRSFIAMLRLVKPILAYPQYFFSYHYDAEYYFLRIKDNIDSCYAIDADVEMHTFPVDQISVVIPIWQNTPQIVKNDNRVWMAHWLCEKAYLEKYNEFRTLYFAIALESLFGTSDAELRFSISLRTARFLSKDANERKKIFQDVKNAYDIRSSIVHGLKRTLSVPVLKKTEITLRESVRKCLLKIMQDGNFIEAFDSPTEKYNGLLKELVLGDM